MYLDDMSVYIFMALYSNNVQNYHICFLLFWLIQEANMEHVRLATKSGAPQAEIAAQLIGMIDTLIADCR